MNPIINHIFIRDLATKKDLIEIKGQDTVYLDKLPPKFNIRADISNGLSVQFDLDGPGWKKTNLESNEPFCTPQDNVALELTENPYVLTIRAFEKIQGKGKKTIKSIPFKVLNSVTVPPTPVPTPTPTPTPVPVPTPTPGITKVVQKSNVFYKNEDHNSLSVSNTEISQGGLVHYRGGKKLTITKCYSLGAPEDIGTYFVLVATKPGTELVWDNTGLKDKWITSGQEAALRVMGRAKSAIITNVDFVNRLHLKTDNGPAGIMNPKYVHLKPVPPLLQDPGTLWTDWKQVVQIRDVDVCEFHGGRIVGLIDIGSQINPLTPQHVGSVLLHSVGMSHDPVFHDNHGKVTRVNCYKIDRFGRTLLDAQGRPLLWSDQVWQ